VQRRRRDDRVDGLIEDQAQHVLAPDPRAIPQTLAGQVDHLLGGVDGQDTPVRDELEHRFGHAACAAPDVEHRRVLGNAAGDPLEDRRRPLLLRPASAVVGLGVPGRAHGGQRIQRDASPTEIDSE
jgi:hypothetical protein